LDAHGRRILWGWIKEERSDDAMRAAGWSGVMSLPRVLNLDGDGSLRITTLPELSTLRAAEQTVKEGDCVLSHASGEVLFSGIEGGRLELTLNDGASELLHAIYSPEKHAWTVDNKEIALNAGDSPRLHAYVDASVIEVILSERIGYTKRFYFDGATAPDVSVRTHSDERSGKNPEAWSITPISQDRLTTPG
jgi:beta-fructofuranosidase